MNGKMKKLRMHNCSKVLPTGMALWEKSGDSARMGSLWLYHRTCTSTSEIKALYNSQ